VSLAAHFAGRSRARALFEALREALEAVGPVRVVANETRLSFMTRVRFAACAVRSDRLRCGLWLVRPVRARCFDRIVCYGPRAFVHEFGIRSEADLTPELRRRLREAYEVGRQAHVRDPSWKRARRADRPPPGPMKAAIVVWTNPRARRTRRRSA
jgi:hypothetical protein